MKAVRITKKGGPEVLETVEVPDPSAGPSEVLVEVKASALNRADLLQCLGFYPAPAGVPSDIPGLEYAGVVTAAGPRVIRWRPGDAVMGIVGGGAFAQRVAVHERECVPVPSGLELTSAAAVPEAFFTAFDALVLQGNLRSGEHLLIHAVSSGVGTAAVQIGLAVQATVLGTSRSENKLARCASELKLTHGILCKTPPARFREAVREATGGRGADLVLDLVGGDYFPETLASLAPRARVLLVGLLGGSGVEIDLRSLLTYRTTVVGTVLRSRPLEEKIALAQAFERQMLPLFQSKQLKPVVDSVFPMAQIQNAFERMVSNQSFGKVVVHW
jgi:putative PIG3 family NAD(P)H quinone oxidoreductase